MKIAPSRRRNAKPMKKLQKIKLFGVPRERLGGILEALGGVLESSWRLLGASWRRLGGHVDPRWGQDCAGTEKVPKTLKKSLILISYFSEWIPHSRAGPAVVAGLV